MSDQQRKSPPAPSANGRSAPINLDRQRKLRELIANHPQMTARRLDFKAGDTLVRENEIAQDAQAFLVVEGALEERQERYLPGRGQVTETLFDVQPGEVAFVQSLIPEYAAQPAYTSVVAAADGYALLLQQEDSLLRQTAGIVAGEFRIRLKLLQPLWDLKRQLDEARNALRGAETRAANALHILAQDRKDQEALSGVVAEERSGRRASQAAAERLEKDLQHAREEARHARERMHAAVAALDEERQHMQLRALGEELYLDRMRRKAIACGLPADELELTEDECKLLLGEEPPDIAALRETALSARDSREWTVSATDEFDSAMDALLADDRTAHSVSPFLAETPGIDMSRPAPSSAGNGPPTTLAATPGRKRTGPPPLPTVVVGARQPEQPGDAPRIELDLDELEESADGMLVDESELIAPDEPPAPPTLSAGSMATASGEQTPAKTGHFRPPFATLGFDLVDPNELEIVGPPSSRRPQGHVMPVPAQPSSAAGPPTERLGSIEGFNPYITGTMPAARMPRPPTPVSAPPRPKPKR